jgi:hypothetical protein
VIGQTLTIASDTRVTLIGTSTTVAPNVTDVLAVGRATCRSKRVGRPYSDRFCDTVSHAE